MPFLPGLFLTKACRPLFKTGDPPTPSPGGSDRSRIGDTNVRRPERRTQELICYMLQKNINKIWRSLPLQAPRRIGGGCRIVVWRRLRKVAYVKIQIRQLRRMSDVIVTKAFLCPASIAHQAETHSTSATSSTFRSTNFLTFPGHNHVAVELHCPIAFPGIRDLTLVSAAKFMSNTIATALIQSCNIQYFFCPRAGHHRYGECGGKN